MIRLVLASALLAAGLPAQDAACKDRTGIRWVLPFSKAKARAAKAHRLLVIKPIAFGTSPDGGW